MTRLLRLTVAGLLCAAAAACTAIETWGTPRYFERVVGVAFSPEGTAINCRVEAFVDYSAYRRVALPRAVTADLRQRGPAILGGHPVAQADEGERRRFPWRRGPLSADARKALEFALTGAESALESPDCHGGTAARMRAAVAEALARPTTFHSFQFVSDTGEVAPEALEFRILDLDQGVLYELVEFS